MKKTVLILVGTAVILAVLIGGAFRYLWSIRQTPEQVRETTKAVRKEFRSAPMDEAAPRLRKLTDELFFTVRSVNTFPFLNG